MLSRLAVAVLAAPLCLAQPALAREAPAAKPSAAEPAAKEITPGQSAARERQKKCGAEWRGLSATEKAAQGPKWPQYFSKCVKRLKQQKA
ncbi:hypothetical protein U8607_17240 [Methylobacterium durans]|jgi:hypothetical protein|uniref:Phosphate starvation-inducible protein PsiF n=1 Tax=Methylobacterium durans TaxID=2202825 RepID=A0A2U8W9Z3_9HYPH|nr:hypothetical protein [Methylobacterium durans]AWN42428.1 hypothetical protein DK389_20420 [Methylobacterium durans]MEA1833833.1 hypothetical protein [Methylobacterium durans]